MGVPSSASSAASDPGTSVSRVQVRAVSQLPPVTEDDYDDWAYDDGWCESAWIPEVDVCSGGWSLDGWQWDPGWQTEDDEDHLCVYTVRRREADTEEMLADSGSQSTACRKDFAPAYGIDDTEKARLWDTRDQEIKSYGEKVVDIEC